MERCFLNIFVSDLERAQSFYRGLFDLTLRFSSDWFVHLGARDKELLEIGLLRRDCEVVPHGYSSKPAGSMLTIVVSDVDAIQKRAVELGARIIEEPRNLFYGQRRMVMLDPDGYPLDISSECEPESEWMKKVQQAPEGHYYES